MNIRQFAVVFLLLGAEFFCPAAAPACPAAGALRVSFLNVGQGDAALITCSDGKTHTLIDAGTDDSLYPEGEKLFRDAFLSRFGPDGTLKLALSTHPHPDHIHGFLEVLRTPRLRPQVYIDNGASNPDTSREEEVRRLARRYSTYVRLQDAEAISMEICPGRKSARITIWQPDSEQRRLLHCPENLNDCSLVSRLDYQGASFLFSADTLLLWEEMAVQPGGSRFSLRADVLKAGHHGSSSTSAAFLRAVRPQFVILSTGEPGKGLTEKYAFPQESVIDRLRSYFGAGNTTQWAASRIAACSPAYDACEWRAKSVPPAVISTAVSGTIDVFVNEGRLCISRDKAGSGKEH